MQEMIELSKSNSIPSSELDVRKNDNFNSKSITNYSFFRLFNLDIRLQAMKLFFTQVLHILLLNKLNLLPRQLSSQNHSIYAPT